MAGSPTRNMRNKAQGQEPSFRPHQRYPRLNADAGKEEAAAKARRPARRVVLPSRRETAARPRIRLDSAFEAPAPALQARTARAGTATRRRSRSQANELSINWARLVSLFAMLALIGIGYWLLNSPNFNISKVELSGNRLLTSEEVVRVSGVDKINVFGLNEEEVAAKIKTLPYILQANVTKALPDKITVNVTERQSILNWKIGGNSYLVDPDGVVLDTYFEQDLPEEAKAFPVIESLDDRKLQVGDRVDGNAVRSAQAIQRQLAAADLKVAAIQYAPSSGLVVISAPPSGNWKALLGSDAQLDQKINILKGLLADKTLKWSYADLRFINKPAIQ